MRGSDTGRRNIEYNPSTILPQKSYNSFSRHREEAIICHLPPTPTDQTLKISSSGCFWSQLGPSEKVPQPLSNVRGMFTETKEPGKITLQEEETQCWDLFMFLFEQVSPKDGSLSICSYYKCLKSVPGRWKAEPKYFPRETETFQSENTRHSTFCSWWPESKEVVGWEETIGGAFTVCPSRLRGIARGNLTDWCNGCCNVFTVSQEIALRWCGGFTFKPLLRPAGPAWLWDSFLEVQIRKETESGLSHGWWCNVLRCECAKSDWNWCDNFTLTINWGSTTWRSFKLWKLPITCMLRVFLFVLNWQL